MNLRMKCYNVTTEMALFVMLYKVIFRFECVHEIHKRDHSPVVVSVKLYNRGGFNFSVL